MSNLSALNSEFLFLNIYEYPSPPKERVYRRSDLSWVSIIHKGQRTMQEGSYGLELMEAAHLAEWQRHVTAQQFFFLNV